jgi:hypothetical protein
MNRRDLIATHLLKTQNMRLQVILLPFGKPGIGQGVFKTNSLQTRKSHWSPFLCILVSMPDEKFVKNILFLKRCIEDQDMLT